MASPQFLQRLSLRARERIEGEILALAAKFQTNCDMDRLQATPSSMRDGRNDPTDFEGATACFVCVLLRQPATTHGNRRHDEPLMVVIGP